MTSMVATTDSPVRTESRRRRKRSFLWLPAQIDAEALLADYQSIPREAWATSHWNIHCSADMLLLRGGNSGTAEDFSTDKVTDTDILGQLPYLSRLLSAEGPFGLPTYAFIFRMKPMGVTRPHVDNDPAWYDPFRIHIPITTNDGAYLLSEKRAKHLSVGEAWTFDNQSLHAVVNGDSVRAHLIFDVLPNPKLDELLANAEWDRGEEDVKRWQQAQMPSTEPVLSPAQTTALSVTEKIDLGLDPDGFACLVTACRSITGLGLLPIRAGDVVYAVNGTEECAVARTAMDYLLLRHRPGETVRLGLIRNRQRVTVNLKLRRNAAPMALRKTWRRLRSLMQSRSL